MKKNCPPFCYSGCAGALKVSRHNAFFAHPEHVITAMPGDENKPVRDIAVDKIMSLRETLTAGHTDNFKKQDARKFKVPSINKNAISYRTIPSYFRSK